MIARNSSTLIAIIAFFGVANADLCAAPTPPELTVDAETIDRRDMAKLFRAVKSFQAQVVGYRECLADNRATLTALQVEALHDASVNEEENVVAAFNTVFEAFKRRNQAR